MKHYICEVDDIKILYFLTDITEVTVWSPEKTEAITFNDEDEAYYKLSLLKEHGIAGEDAFVASETEVWKLMKVKYAEYKNF
ncbi:hypothetical protein phiOC_p211 [Ochrobactrum phage vB_OspM_OC]|nr:hypothetical protein phiOC_p211 [Ochrobactrum phage vB_OspM_OC]